MKRKLAISIHAPREGGDAAMVESLKDQLKISIHAPREGGDPVRSGTAISVSISIHAPREGGDTAQAGGLLLLRNFNPRPPRGGRPPLLLRYVKGLAISIPAPRAGGAHHHRLVEAYTYISTHAPRVGGDDLRLHPPRRAGQFQSTPPARGATAPPCFRTAYQCLEFQSTPPARGATVAGLFEL